MGLQSTKLFYQKGHAVEHCYLCNYRPLADGHDKLSKSLLRFKSGLQEDLKAWIDCAVKELEQLVIPNDVMVIRALGSRETRIEENSNTALDLLGKAITAHFQLEWNPTIIGKMMSTPSLKSLSAKERSAVIKHVYCFTIYPPGFNGKRILLIDDILTTGATALSIIRLFKQYLRDTKFMVFTLAKSAYGNGLNEPIYLAGESYDWQEKSGWIAAEETTEYNNYSRLTKAILADDFSSL